MHRIGIEPGCQSIDTVKAGVGTGSAKVCMPTRRSPVCRSGTVATRSEPRARASALEKPPTTMTLSRFSPSASRAASMGPPSRLGRETVT